MNFRPPTHLLLFLLGMCLLSGVAFAQIPPVEWQQTAGPYGGSFTNFVEEPGIGRLWATASHHVYYSDDEGETWVATGLGDIYKASFAFRPEGAVFVDRYRSNDQGETWQQVGLPDSISIRGLAIDDMTGHVVAATSEGIYFSADDGESWTQALAQSTRNVWKAGEGNLFAILAYPHDPLLLRSVDGGASWSEVTTPNLILDDFIAGPDSLFYLLASGLMTSVQRVYVTPDYGDTWELLTDYDFSSSGNCTGNEIIGLTPDKELILSGVKLVSVALDTQECNVLLENEKREYEYAGMRRSSYRTVRAAALTSKGHLYTYSNYSELLKSEDMGATWQVLDGQGIIGTAITSILFDQRTGLEWVGTSRHGLFKSSNLGQEWVYEGFSSLSIEALFAAENAPTLWTSTYEAGLFKSKDNGENWRAVHGPYPGEPTELRGPIIDMQYDAVSGVYYALSQQNDIYYSADAGETWQPTNAPFANAPDPPVISMTISPQGHLIALIKNDIYAGLQGIFKTGDFGATWEQVDTGIPENPYGLLYSDSAGRLWMSDRRDLYLSLDEGVTWEYQITPHGWIHDFFETPEGSLWIAHGYGLLRSVDRGKTWRDEQLNLNNLGVASLGWNEDTSELLVGTGRGGLYRGYIDTAIKVNIKDEREPLAWPTSVNLGNYPNPVAGGSTQITFDLEKDSRVHLVLFDQLGREVVDLLDQPLQKGSHEVTVDFGQLAPGLYFYRLETLESTFTNSVVYLR